MSSPLYPLRLQPVYKDYLWGGDRIAREFGRVVPPGLVAESWEVADRPEGMSVVTNGVLTGSTLHTLMRGLDLDLVGRRGRGLKVLPLLIKLIDARQTLSVQVHPDNAGAARHGGEPKTEMWYILAAEPGAFVYSGLRPGVTPDAFRRAVADQTVESLLNKVPVQAGDAVYIPGGRVHAIGAGCLLLECQQNSNTTYRIYDYGRIGADGKTRELHVEQAIQVIRWEDDAAPLAVPRLVETASGGERWEVLTSPYFRMEQLRLTADWSWPMDLQTFRVVFVERGTVELAGPYGTERIQRGTTLLIPAACPELTLTPVAGKASLLVMSLPG